VIFVVVLAVGDRETIIPRARVQLESLPRTIALGLLDPQAVVGPGHLVPCLVCGDELWLHLTYGGTKVVILWSSHRHALLLLVVDAHHMEVAALACATSAPWSPWVLRRKLLPIVALP
jgi:hypothetical protein